MTCLVGGEGLRNLAYGIGLATLSACGISDTPSQKLEAKAKAAITLQMRDPASAEFRSVLTFPDKNLVCGQINGKNSFGGYTGFLEFYYDRGVVAVSDQSVGFQEHFDKLCIGALKDQAEASKKRTAETLKNIPPGPEKDELVAELKALDAQPTH